MIRTVKSGANTYRLSSVLHEKGGCDNNRPGKSSLKGMLRGIYFLLILSVEYYCTALHSFQTILSVFASRRV